MGKSVADCEVVRQPLLDTWLSLRCHFFAVSSSSWLSERVKFAMDFVVDKPFYDSDLKELWDSDLEPVSGKSKPERQTEAPRGPKHPEQRHLIGSRRPCCNSTSIRKWKSANRLAAWHDALISVFRGSLAFPAHGPAGLQPGRGSVEGGEGAPVRGVFARGFILVSASQ